MSFFASSHRKTWQSTGMINVVLIFILEIILVAFFATSLAKTGSTILASSIIYEGPCAKTKTLNLVLHLLINLISTGLAGSSNYFMQILSSPSRKEIDKAHNNSCALDIGTPSLHNLRYLSRFKWVCWIILLTSALPIHFFFNSSVFETNYLGSDWQLTIGTGSLIEGASFFLPGASLAPAGTWGPLCEGWEQLSIEACEAEYGRGGPREQYGDVVFVVSATNDSNDGWIRDDLFNFTSLSDLSHTWDPHVPPDTLNSLWYSTRCASSKFWYRVDESGQSNCDSLLHGSGTFGTDLFSYPPFGSLLDARPQTVDFQHRFLGLKLRHCLAQPLSRRCKLGLANPILGLVILSGIIKLIVCGTVLMRLDQHSLVTPGDAIESFITGPDQYTAGLGTLDIDDVHHLAAYLFYGGKNRAERLSPSPRPWLQEKRRRLRSTISQAYWVLSYTLLITAVTIAFVSLVVSYLSNQRSLYGPGGSFGPSGQNLVVSLGQPGYLGALLIANAPHILLSLCYFQYNALCTRLCTEMEWNSYGSSYKALRVSHPTGQQTSSYRLQVPYRYGVSLLIGSALLHWLLSNAIFIFISEGGYWLGTRPLIGVASQLGLSEDTSMVALGYSPIAILTLLIVALVVISLPAIFGCYKLKNIMVRGCSSSLVISAACHCYASEHFTNICNNDPSTRADRRDIEPNAEMSLVDNATKSTDSRLLAISQSKIMWGEMNATSNFQDIIGKDKAEAQRHDVSHIGFGSALDEVCRPRKDVWYA
ncbi:hypothetical protein F4777DRAFT_585357 [Nemania sp. FL0916]|nr:hypothetical protein F4777DRAFT_585357 [Nemania sp. FL0916]